MNCRFCKKLISRYLTFCDEHRIRKNETQLIMVYCDQCKTLSTTLKCPDIPVSDTVISATPFDRFEKVTFERIVNFLAAILRQIERSGFYSFGTDVQRFTRGDDESSNGIPVDFQQNRVSLFITNDTHSEFPQKPNFMDAVHCVEADYSKIAKKYGYKYREPKWWQFLKKGVDIAEIF